MDRSRTVELPSEISQQVSVSVMMYMYMYMLYVVVHIGGGGRHCILMVIK